MLHRIQPPSPQPPSLPIARATFPTPFPQTLEYSPAARGTWNIVHTGMLLPKSHQIYICASGCLRGVILTAAEMGESYYRRFHTLELQETDLYATDPETFLIEGITTILQRLPELPPAVLTFTACVHHFLGVNLPYVYRTLRHRFPSVQFAECIMDPIRQTKSIPPEVRERLEIARLLKPSSPTTESATSPKADSEQSEYFGPLGAPCSAKTFHPSGGRGLCDSERSGEHPSGAEKNRNATLKTAPTAHLESHEIAREDSPLSESAQSPRPTATTDRLRAPEPPSAAACVNLLGSNLPLSPESDIALLLLRHNLRLRDFPRCRTYAEFQQMAASRANLYTNPQTRLAAEDLEHRLHQPSLYLPPAWTYQEIQQNLEKLETFLQDILALTPEATEPPSQPHPSELPLPTSATPPALRALPPLGGGLKMKNPQVDNEQSDCFRPASERRAPPADSEQSERLHPFEAPCSQADSEQSERLRPARASSHPSRSQSNLREGGDFHKESFSCKEIQPKPETVDVNLPTHSPATLAGRVSVDSVGSPRPTATTNQPSRPRIDLRSRIALLELRFESLRAQLEDTPLALDSTFTPLPFSLARLLVSHHLNVTEIYADTIAPDDEQNFHWLQTHAPQIRLFPTKHPAMRTQPREHLDPSGRLPIALGQKAAYFTGTHHFLPEIEAGGHYGLEAIHWLQTALSRAALLETDPEPILKKKAWGAPSCI